MLTIMAYRWIMRSTSKIDAINVKLMLFHRHLAPVISSVALDVMRYMSLNHSRNTVADAMVAIQIANGVMAKYTSFT
jgi:hypothetical protein